MIIYLGADHRGVQFKEKIKAALTSLKVNYIDLGTNDEKVSCDYPVSAYRVAASVARDKDSFGILICNSGIGQSIAANKVRGAYAALCCNAEVAKLCREHNNANILVLSAKFIKSTELKKVIASFINTKFEGGRHLRRLRIIQKIEKTQKI